jgi:hypothetical protein
MQWDLTNVVADNELTGAPPGVLFPPEFTLLMTSFHCAAGEGLRRIDAAALVVALQTKPTEWPTSMDHVASLLCSCFMQLRRQPRIFSVSLADIGGVDVMSCSKIKAKCDRPESSSMHSNAAEQDPTQRPIPAPSVLMLVVLSTCSLACADARTVGLAAIHGCLHPKALPQKL